MATRSRIGIQLKDESILSVYHHWDGYPSWLGRILKTHFNTKELVSELIDGGDMSVCWTTDRWGDTSEYGGQMKTEGTEYGPQYYSGRGEDCPPKMMTKEEYLTKDNNEEYAYIFRDGEWICYDMHSFDYRKQPEIVDIPEGALHC